MIRISTIVNETLYLFPGPNEAVGDLAQKLSGAAAGALQAKAASASQAASDVLRIETWQKAAGGVPERFVSLVAEYTADQVVLGDTEFGAVLAVVPPTGLNEALQVATAWTPGAVPETKLLDTDGDRQPDMIVIYNADILQDLDDADNDRIPDFFDNCLLKPNTDQSDIDNDGYGTVCDGDLNNDGKADAADVATLAGDLGRENCLRSLCQADLNLDGDTDGDDLGNFINIGIGTLGPSGRAD